MNQYILVLSGDELVALSGQLTCARKWIDESLTELARHGGRAPYPAVKTATELRSSNRALHEMIKRELEEK